MMRSAPSFLHCRETEPSFAQAAQRRGGLLNGDAGCSIRRGHLFGMMDDERFLSRCVPFPRPPCCRPLPAAASLVCVRVCELVLVHPVDVVVVLAVHADLSLDLPTDCRNGGRDKKVAKSRVA